MLWISRPLMKTPVPVRPDASGVRRPPPPRGGAPGRKPVQGPPMVP